MRPRLIIILITVYRNIKLKLQYPLNTRLWSHTVVTDPEMEAMIHINIIIASASPPKFSHGYV
jgi:hypothetical protein